MSNDIEIGDKVKIKPHSPYFMDHEFWESTDIEESIVFTVKKIEEKENGAKYYSIYANGFGNRGNYGNGCIHIRSDFLINLSKGVSGEQVTCVIQDERVLSDQEMKKANEYVCKKLGINTKEIGHE